jgi:hypothetical protein
MSRRETHLEGFCHIPEWGFPGKVFVKVAKIDAD